MDIFGNDRLAVVAGRITTQRNGIRPITRQLHHRFEHRLGIAAK